MTDTQPTPTLDLDTIQARVDAATPGPWYPQTDYGYDFIATQIGGYEHGVGWLNFGAGSQARADREFVTAARQDMPALIARVRDLEAELDGRDEEARERWIQKQEDQLGIRFADFRNGKWEMDIAMGREMAAAYVAMAKTMLGDAPNYTETKIEFDVKVAESPELYTLVVQRHAPGALTPHEARQRAEARVASLEAERDGWAENSRNEERIWAARVAELEKQLAEAQAATDTNREISRVLLDELAARRPAAECGAPHPVADDTRCERQPGHDGWHAANVGAWPTSTLPPVAPAPARGDR
ncbi:hypothetical protein [Kitasatospora phosalacinea]|uniref:Uncharacterized protein n=1 Tax=Kitasatospora phosalacinea TaxID=2065 RepID=A0ABW6GRP0_9ACTN